MVSRPFPPEFPPELAAAAFVSSTNEAAWRHVLAISSIEWLSANGYAVLGTEVWIPRPDSIQSLPYFQNVERENGESWGRFVIRAKLETVGYLRRFNSSDLAPEGDIHFHVTWISELEFQELVVNK